MPFYFLDPPRNLPGLIEQSAGRSVTVESRLYAAPVQRLITELGKLPGIGTRTAQRLAFHLLNRPIPHEEAQPCPS